MDERKKLAPPTPEEYRTERMEIALMFAPRIYPCPACQWPRAYGYICSTCGDN